MDYKIARTNLKEFLKGTEGKYFTVVFQKKDGSIRKMNARLGVKRYLKGGKNNVEAIDRPYLTVFDQKKGAYRTVNLDTVQEVHYLGKVWKVV